MRKALSFENGQFMADQLEIPVELVQGQHDHSCEILGSYFSYGGSIFGKAKMSNL